MNIATPGHFSGCATRAVTDGENGAEAPSSGVEASPRPFVWSDGNTAAAPALPQAQIHQRVAPIVRRMVWTMIGPDPEFNDITHDAFVRILQGLPRLKDANRLEQWAARVTINTVNNALRRRRYRRVTSWDPHTEPDVLVGHTDFDAQHVANRVANVFAHLPERERALLELRWFGSTTIDDIARTADCSPRTVKRRIQRALTRFERNVQKDAEIATWLSQPGRTLDDSEE